jgi:hypothetical protein
MKNFKLLKIIPDFGYPPIYPPLLMALGGFWGVWVSFEWGLLVNHDFPANRVYKGPIA